MSQDVVGGRHKEEEIRQGKLLQIVGTLHSPVIAAGSPSDDFVLRTVDLGAIQGLYQINAAVPAGAPSGSIPVQLNVGGAAAQSAVTMYVN